MMDWEIITEEARSVVLSICFERLELLYLLVHFHLYRLSDFKRTTTKNWMILKFGGLLECAEKATVCRVPRLLIAELSNKTHRL